MVYNLKFGRKIYNYWGSHPILYKIGSFISFLGRENYLRKRAIRKVNLIAGNIVLDLACGNGVNFSYLREEISSNGRIVGLDYSDGMLSYARKRISQNKWRNVQLIQADGAQVNFKPETMDGAFCSLGLSAIPDHYSAIVNVYRALKKGKRFVILDARPFTGFWRILNPIIKPVFKFTTNWNYNKNIIEDVKRIFEDIKTEEYNSGTIFILVAMK